MNNEFVVWGNGSKSESGSFMKGKKYTNIQGAWKKNIDSVFIKDECAIYIAQGELYKEGKLNFEKLDTPGKKDNLSTEREKLLVNLASNIANTKEVVIDLAFGDNHLLVQTLQGNVYSWGDNYYGQLGLANPFVAKVFEPNQVRIGQVKQVFAYKDNSFAIDVNNKLWAWGKSDFIGTNIKGNVFKPIQILSQYNIRNFKIINDRIIVSVLKDNKLIDKEKPKKEEQEDISEEVAKTPAEEIKIKEIPTVIKDDLIKKSEPQKEQSNVLLMSIIKKVNEDVSDAFSKLNSENKNLQSIRHKVLSDQVTVKKIGLENMWGEINIILNQSVKKKASNANMLSLADTIDVFAAALNSVITGSFNDLNVERLVTNFVDYEKEVLKLIQDMNTDLIRDETVITFIKNIKRLLSYFVKYKKIESLVHKMSAHQFLLKSYKFENVLDALKFILHKDENVEKKLYLIEKSFESLKKLVDKTNTSFVEIENLFGKLNHINLSDDDASVEKFIHKYIIESTFYIKDLWLLLINHVESERKSKEKEEQLIKVLDKYKELYSIQMYLRSISLKNVFITDKSQSAKNQVGIDSVDIRNKVLIHLTEIDGVITKLESFMKERLDKTKNMSDNFSNELIIMYATSLLDNAYQKKILFQLVFSIEKKKANGGSIDKNN